MLLCSSNVPMGHYKKYFLNFTLLISLVFIFCEFLIYYVVLIQCSWPDLSPKSEAVEGGSPEEPVRAILLADTHLLGPRKGHWFDKLRREWQMRRAFQTAIALHRPDIVFILGDLFDEGLWCSDVEFAAYVRRFHHLFWVPQEVRLAVVVGNHDIGFHYGISPYLQERFSKAFQAPAVQLLSVRGVHFVLINSMAMEGDGCFLCRNAEIRLAKIAKKLSCSKTSNSNPKEFVLRKYSRPILLQHFPLYRESDEECSGPDEAPEEVKRQKFRERWDCLSKEATELLLNSLEPRLVVTGHTHHGCRRYHQATDSLEHTLPSFSWRNKDNPSFMMAVLTEGRMGLSRCHLPRESTVLLLYSLSGLALALYAACLYQRHRRWPRLFKIQ